MRYHKYHAHHKRRFPDGTYDLGGPTIPPVPSGVAMVDRGDGNSYYLTFNVNLTVTTLPVNWKQFVYPANQGPTIDVRNGDTIRLFFRDQALGYEFVNTPARSRHSSPNTFLDVSDNTAVYAVTATDPFFDGDNLGWELQ